ncbi:pilin [Patescibacteria group bacterium]|nr:pilin [Patescibacteria group bacterium]
MKTKKILITSFFSFVITSGILLLIMPLGASAQYVGGATGGADDYCKLTGQEFDKAIRVQLAIPGVTQKHPETGEHYIKDTACYISGIYRYFAGVAGILATVMMMYGGIRYVVSFGNPQKISEAKDTIVSALLGLALTLSSFVILYFINPNLTTLEMGAINRIDPIFQDTKWCEDFDSEPIADGATDCNDRGTITAGKEKGGECTYRNCPQAGKFCVKGSDTDMFDFENYHCGNPKEECNKIVAKDEISVDRLKTLCRGYSYYDPNYPDVSGECRALTRPMLCPADWGGIIGARAGCFYFPLLDCETFLGDNWTEAESCQGDCQDSCYMGWVSKAQVFIWLDDHIIPSCQVSTIIYKNGTEYDVQREGGYCFDELLSTPLYMADLAPEKTTESTWVGLGSREFRGYVSRCCQKKGTDKFESICTLGGSESLENL